MNPLQAHVIALLHELAHGPETGAAYGHFSEPAAGLLPTMERLNAAQASAQALPARPTLAAFVAHLTQLLTFAAGQLNGAIEFPDFAAPWQTGAVSAEEWTTIRADLAAAFTAMQAVLERRELESEELNVAQSALTHAAYHAGAIRFKALNLLAGQ
ncbi:hypothetical protein [Deinococcus sp. UYEF24]